MAGNSVNSSGPIHGIDYHWDGITFAQSGGYYPPDNALAASATTVISAENGAIQFASTTGTNISTESLSTFFHPVMAPSGYFLTDPRILYDTANSRFVVTVDEVSNHLSSSYILMAVSKAAAGSAPTMSSSNWTYEAASTSYSINGVATWADQPLVSVDGHNIYVTTNQFSSSTGSYKGDVLTVFNDAGLYGDSVSSPYPAVAYAASSYQPAAIAGGGEYFVSDTHNSLSIFASIPTATGFVDTTPVSISLGTIDYGNGSYSAAQYGASYRLDAGDGRVTSAAFDSSNKLLYVVFEVQPARSSTLPSAEWVQLDMSSSTPKVLHFGNLNSLLDGTPQAGAATFNASVAVDGNGDALFNFNVSGSNMLPADFFTVWKGAGSKAAPSFSAPTDYHDSANAYVDPAHDAVGRWGDYSTAVASGANGFWISNEFANGTVAGYGSWGTSIAHVNTTLIA